MTGRRTPATAGATPPRLRILHCLSPDAGTIPARCASVIAALGAGVEHAIVGGEGAAPPAGADGLPRGVRIARPPFPPLAGRPWPGRLKRLAAAMAGYDLLCSWGAGALDAALAQTLFADVYRLAPLVHHEDAAAAEARPRSVLMRRIALGRTAALVVPSRAAERIALDQWQQPRGRVRLIPQGIDTAALAAVPRRDAVPGLVKRRGELWLGTLAAPGGEAALVALVRALAALPEQWQLVIAGEAERAPIMAAAEACAIDDRVHLIGSLGRAPPFGLFDLFAADGGDAIREAMAAGLPVLAPSEGEAAELLASENGPFLAPSEEDRAAALVRLATDDALRRRVGEANRARARAEFDERRMVARLVALYRGLLPGR